ncbi:MAG TPA: radical SAM protein [Polyangiaceae bacterium]|nr:radical SAM protein [Polyangiaceae bacterium]
MGTQHATLTRPDPPSGLGSAGRTPVPRLVQWMVTERCGLSCPHCLSSPPSARPELDLSAATRLLDELAALGVPELLLTGGEPLDRPDLPVLLGLIAERRVPWSLNTARAPDREARAAIEAWPPRFVAVSVDGPELLHDRFRGRAGCFAEATAAIRYFRGIGVDVAAGTTITRQNLPALGATHALVEGLGVAAWGLHLLVPEGRAHQRPDLMPRRAELRELLAFVAHRRQLGGLRVGMADELGYAGPWEPLVRESAFYCGAGRSTCVILADGEVVPCTTTDRSTSAGNVRRESLAALWARGFPALDAHPLGEDCARCAELEACRGGCWLMRRHGLHCSRDLWPFGRRVSRLGAGLGLALTACGGPPRAGAATPGGSDPTAALAPATSASAGPEPAPPLATELAPPPSASASAAGDPAPTIDPDADPETALRQWLRAHAWSLCQPSPALTAALRERLGDDPLATYLAALDAGGCDRELAVRFAAIRAALPTRHALPAVASLWWRDVLEWGLDRKAPAERTATERALLAAALRELGPWAVAAAVAELAGSIDVPSPVQPAANDPRCMRYKSGRCPQAVLAEPTPRQRRHAAEQRIAAEPPGAPLALTLHTPPGAGLLIRGPGGTRPSTAGRLTLGAFDLLVIPRGSPVAVELAAEADALDRTLLVHLPPDVELTLLDLAALAAAQHPDLAGLLPRERRRLPPAIGLVLARTRAMAAGATSRDPDDPWRHTRAPDWLM